MTKKFIDTLPLLTIILIYYAYCNLYYFYSEFKVDIYNYVSNSELLLSFLPTLVVVTATIGTYIISYIIGRSSRDKDNAKRQTDVQANELQTTKKHFFQKPLGILTIIVVITATLFFLSRYFLKTHHNKRYELKEYFLYLSFFNALSTYLILKGIGGNEVFTKYSPILLLALIIYIGKEIGNYRKLDAAEIKDGVSSYSLSFMYNQNKHYKTDSSLVLIGQTQSTLFLYNRKDSSTLVFDRQNIDSLIIR